MKRLLFTTVILLGLFSCGPESDVELKERVLSLPDQPFEYAGDNDQSTLGRVLFYDPQLSINNSISCASCHKQSAAFSDNRQFSRGFDNRNTLRNSMPIQNLATFVTTFDGNFNIFIPGAGLFWDGRGIDPNNSLLLPIINHIEMGIPNLDYLTEKLSSIEYYPELFENAFGSDEITPEGIGFALNQFLMNIQSGNTRFDQSFANSSVLSPKEQLGKALFLNTYDCNSCHQVESPSGYLFAGTFANVGLDKNYSDSGLEQFTNNSDDNGKFKIPSLRNVALTAPYMHDGRFATLDEVIRHYSNNIENNPNLDSRLRDGNGNPIRFEIQDHEVSAIVAFLGTLTDHQMITDEKLSDPFILK